MGAVGGETKLHVSRLSSPRNKELGGRSMSNRFRLALLSLFAAAAITGSQELILPRIEPGLPREGLCR